MGAFPIISYDCMHIYNYPLKMSIFKNLILVFPFLFEFHYMIAFYPLPY